MDAPLPLARFGRFTVEAELGRGGFGVVYQVTDAERREEVALKLLHRVSPAAVLRFKNEFRALADVTHPNLLALHELTVDGETCFFTMELVDGVDLVAWARGGGARAETARAETQDAPRTTADLEGAHDVCGARRETPSAEPGDDLRIRTAMAGVARAVAALHGRGMLHRDLKPSNCLVRADGSAVVLDYGLVSTIGRETVTFEGTPAYAAPEQFGGGTVGEAADWYAFGVMLFEALTGRLPFSGGRDQQAADKRRRRATPVRELRPDAPLDLATLADELLSTDPALRPGSSAVLACLETSVEGNAGAAPFVGRQGELGALEELASRARVGASEAALLSGRSGIGKTRIATEFLARREARGDLVLRSRCHPRESVSYNAFDGIVDDLARTLATDASPPPAEDLIHAALMFPVLRAKSDDAAPFGDPRERRAVAVRALRRLFEHVARRGLLLLWVDDHQWADRDSVELLEELWSEPPRGVMMLLTQRTAGAAAEARPPWITRALEVGPLSSGDAQALYLAVDAERVGSSPPTNGLEELLRESAGHPLMLLELARFRREDDALQFDLDDALARRVAALPEDARRLMEVLAVSAPGLREDVLFDAGDVAPRKRTETLRSLRSAWLVRVVARESSFMRVDTFHDKIRETAIASLSEDREREIHARLLDALARAGEDEPERIVAHVAGAGDSARAMRMARTAAERAFGSLAFDRAASLYRFARAHDASVELARKLAEALACAHRGREAAEVYLEIADTDASGRTDALRRAAELLLTNGQLTRAEGVLRDLLAEMRLAMPSSTAGAVADLVGQRLLLTVERKLPWTRTKIEPQALAVMRSIALGFGMIDNLRAASYQTRWLRGALASGEDRLVGQAMALEGIFRGSLGHASRPEGYALIERAEELASRTEDPELQCWAQAARATVDALGSPSSANIRALELAVDGFRSRTLGNGWAITSLTLVRALSVRIRGDFQGVRKLVSVALADAKNRGDLYLETTLRRGATFLHLADDEPDAVHQALHDTDWKSPYRGFHLQHWVGLDAASEADLYAGEGHRTLERRAAEWRGLERSLVQRQQRVRILSKSLRARLLLAGARAGQDVRASLAACRKLADALEGEMLPYAVIRGKLVRAGVHALMHDDERANALLRDVMDEAAREGLEFLREVAASRLGRRLGGDEGRALGEGAARWFSRQRVRNPERILEVEAPFA